MFHMPTFRRLALRILYLLVTPLSVTISLFSLLYLTVSKLGQEATRNLLTMSQTPPRTPALVSATINGHRPRASFLHPKGPRAFRLSPSEEPYYKGNQ